MAPLANVPGSHFGEMAFVTVTPDDMDVCFSALQPRNCVDCHLSQGTVSSKEMSGNNDTPFISSMPYFILFYFILFYFIYRGTTTDVLAGSS